MPLRVTSVFSKNVFAFIDNARYIVNQGGTSSSKTYSILQLLLLIATRKDGILISVVSESMPHLRRGAMRDFINIIKENGIYSEDIHNKSTNEFLIGKSKIEFFSADQSSKLRGSRRDVLYVNECNNITLQSFNELAIRTRLCAFLDFNPVSEFWVHTDILPDTSKNIAFIKSTYRDNEHLQPAIVQDIESRKERDPNWWKVYGLGEVGSLEGVVFNNWRICDAVPESPKRVIGIDFGFSNDPTVIVSVSISDGKLYWDELLYRTGMTNSEIAGFIKQSDECKGAIVVCDSAEPKSIHELNLAGIRAIGADKGADSVRTGIDKIQQHDLLVTRRSVNGIKELRNYRWAVAKDGKPLNTPIDFWNHFIDASRYASSYLLKTTTLKTHSRVHIPK
jgi:phage terminase large subunit